MTQEQIRETVKQLTDKISPTLVHHYPIAHAMKAAVSK